MAQAQTVKFDWRLLLVGLSVIGSLIWLMLLKPIPQDLAYHLFADGREFFGIPNFLDVVSNLPFLLVGYLGIQICSRVNIGVAKPAWMLLFVGVLLVCVGSSYYHYNPTSTTLVWDRLPMTVGFMGLFVALLSEYIDARLLKFLLIPMILLGAGSVAYWYYTDDLRLYAWVQFMPLLVIAVLLLFYRSPYSHSSLLFAALFWYLLAKVFEYFDKQIYDLSNSLLSGHSIKHVMAAAGCYALVLYLRRRHPWPAI